MDGLENISLTLTVDDVKAGVTSGEIKQIRQVVTRFGLRYVVQVQTDSGMYDVFVNMSTLRTIKRALLRGNTTIKFSVAVNEKTSKEYVQVSA